MSKFLPDNLVSWAFRYHITITQGIFNKLPVMLATLFAIHNGDLTVAYLGVAIAFLLNLWKNASDEKILSMVRETSLEQQVQSDLLEELRQEATENLVETEGLLATASKLAEEAGLSRPLRQSIGANMKPGKTGKSGEPEVV